jgi:hypothetical protein
LCLILPEDVTNGKEHKRSAQATKGSRVGAYAAAIYHTLAMPLGLSDHERKRRKSRMRVAAMLHDVGKIAISDAILKQPGRLTEDESDIMKTHTLLGARLFSNPVSEVTPGPVTPYYTTINTMKAKAIPAAPVTRTPAMAAQYHRFPAKTYRFRPE